MCIGKYFQSFQKKKKENVGTSLDSGLTFERKKIHGKRMKEGNSRTKR